MYDFYQDGGDYPEVGTPIQGGGGNYADRPCAARQSADERGDNDVDRPLAVRYERMMSRVLELSTRDMDAALRIDREFWERENAKS